MSVLNLFVSTFILPVGGTVVADTGAIGGSHYYVVGLLTEQVAQGAVGVGAAAGLCICITGGSQRISHSVRAGGPGHLGYTSAAHQLAGHAGGRTRLCTKTQRRLLMEKKKRQPLYILTVILI